MGVCLLQSDIVDLKYHYLKENSVKSMHDDEPATLVIDESCVQDMPPAASYIELQPPGVIYSDNQHSQQTDSQEDPVWDIPIVSSSDELLVLPVNENHHCGYLDIGMEVTCSQSEEVTCTQTEEVDTTSEYEEPVSDTNSCNETYRRGLAVKRKVTRLAVNTIKRFRPSSSLSSIRPSSPISPPPYKPKQDMMDLLDRKRKRVKDGLYQYVLWKQQYLKEQDSTFERRKSIKYASQISCGT